MPNSNTQTWGVAQHDTIPAVDFALNPLETHAYLFAFLASEGEQFEVPYTPVRNALGDIIQQAAARERQGTAPSRDVTPQRLRTWKKTFENSGILTVDSVTKTIELTPLGRTLKNIYDKVNERIEGANDHVAKVTVDVLNRSLLRNPLDETEYPEDSDVFPFRFMWRAMRQLDNKLHWQEMNRVIMKVTHKSDENEAIRLIKDVRAKGNGIYNETSVGLLGPSAVEDGEQTKRRITPWFTRAGFGGLLITATDDADGFRHLVDKYIPLIDDALQNEPTVPANVISSKSACIRYLSAEAGVANVLIQDSDKLSIDRVIKAVERYGNHKIICISGIPGTGKTHLAKQVAMQLIDNDAYRFSEVQFHESTSYDDFMEGFVPKPSGEGFELKRKTFRTINRRAKLDPAGARYILLIEEFTRANVHAILGELITYIEHRDRPFRLSLSQEEEAVAPNLVIMATMNPRDKSALVLDQAILRRLHRIELGPSVDRLREILEGKIEEGILDRLASWFEIYIDILPFGHAEFSRVRNEDDLRELWSGTLRHFITDVVGNVREAYKELDQAYPWRS